jgi:hypothetical protein
MWDTVRNPDFVEKQEEVLKKEYWKDMIDNGAGFERFLNTPDSAWKIVSRMLEDRMRVVPQGDTKKRLAGIWGRLFGKQK